METRGYLKNCRREEDINILSGKKKVVYTVDCEFTKMKDNLSYRLKRAIVDEVNRTEGVK